MYICIVKLKLYIMSDLVKEAIEIYGKAIVSEVSMMVEMSDPDGMYTQFEDMGMYEHAECVEFLYFG